MSRITPPSAPGNAASLPSPTTGDAGKVVTVNMAEDGFELDAPTGGGGSAAGVPVLKAFPFDHTTPNLATGYDTGYSPAVGDVILDAWFDVIEAFDGTTPKADFGHYILPAATHGMFSYTSNGVIDLSAPWDLNQWAPGQILTPSATGAAASLAVNAGQFGAAVVPARFAESHPIKIVANQTGLAGGTALDSTAGSAVLYLLVVTPPNS